MTTPLQWLHRLPSSAIKAGSLVLVLIVGVIVCLTSIDVSVTVSYLRSISVRSWFGRWSTGTAHGNDASRRSNLEIQKNGHGVARGKWSGIFGPFFTTKPTGEGPSLGMATVRRITQIHGSSSVRNTNKGGVRAVLKINT